MTAMTSFRQNRPLTDDEMRTYAPSIFATEAHDSRSERFVPVPTTNVLRALASQGFAPYAVQQAKVRNLDKADYTKHVVRLRSDSMPTPTVGGVWPELLLINGNDGSASYRLMLGAYRFVCANGMIGGTTFDEVRVKHQGANVLDDVIEGTWSVVQDAPRLTAQIDDWSSIKVSRDEAMLLAETAHMLRYPEAHVAEDDEGYKAAPVSPVKLLSARRYDDQDATLWNTFNRLQENTVRGGLRGMGMRAGRPVRATTRPVAGIDSNTTLNKALWTMTEGFAALKRAA